jgi:hypothetical protein
LRATKKEGEPKFPLSCRLFVKYLLAENFGIKSDSGGRVENERQIALCDTGGLSQAVRDERITMSVQISTDRDHITLETRSH